MSIINYSHAGDKALIEKLSSRLGGVVNEEVNQVFEYPYNLKGKNIVITNSNVFITRHTIIEGISSLIGYSHKSEEVFNIVRIEKTVTSRGEHPGNIVLKSNLNPNYHLTISWSELDNHFKLAI